MENKISSGSKMSNCIKLHGYTVIVRWRVKK